MKRRLFLQSELRFEKILFVCSLFVMAIIFFSHAYNDLLITTRHGMNFWKILFSNDFLNFYDQNRCVSGNDFYTTTQGCAYNILIYIIFAIWNLPLLLLENLAHIDVMNNVFCIAYAKSIVVFALVISALILKKITVFLGAGKEQQLLSLFLYFTSSLMISTVFNIAQYDLMSVIFQLLGLYAFLQKDNRKFVLWFAIAFCFKYFSLVIFLPLLLLRYKKVWQWVKSLFLMAIPFLITKLPFLLFSAGSSNAIAGEKFSFGLGIMLFTTSFSVFNLFVIVYIGLLVWCYLQEESNDGHDYSVAFWACFVAYAAFCGLLKTNPYWTVFLAPFVVLVIVLSPKRVYINTLLETFGLSALVLMNILRFDWCYFGDTMKSMLMSFFVSESTLSFENSLIYSIIMRIAQAKSNIPLALLTSVFIAAMGALALISYPNKHSYALSEQEFVPLDKDILLLRFLVVSGVCLIPMFALFI